jgi:hypothetical protein
MRAHVYFLHRHLSPLTPNNVDYFFRHVHAWIERDLSDERGTTAYSRLGFRFVVRAAPTG